MSAFSNTPDIKIKTSIQYLNGNNAAEWENNIKYAPSSYPLNWTVKNWFLQDFKGDGHDTDAWRDLYDEDNFHFERLEKVYVPDEDSLEQRMDIFHGQLYSLDRDNLKFRQQGIKQRKCKICKLHSLYFAKPVLLEDCNEMQLISSDSLTLVVYTTRCSDDF